MARRILVTSALPNANGSIHLGHLLEHIQTDIWVRFQRMRAHQCLHVCADDTHGAATMLKAEVEGLEPQVLIERIREEHAADFRGFGVTHDNYYSTHAPENKQLSDLIYERLHARGLIFTREVEQLYDPERKMFLADRFVKGICPRCGEDDQYGDNCESCGATYEAIDLGSPRSTVSGATPQLKASEHYFFDLPQYTDMLKDWTTSGALQPEVANKLAEWLDGGLKAWDISRDAPYFGFLIPGSTDKYFYVWWDAPIGYMASFMNYAQERADLTFDEFWQPESNTEVHHFIGKDIVNFHCLFWPSVLDGAGFRKPTKIHTHGFASVSGAKMSKSRGVFVNAATWLEHLDAEYLRYYFAAKLNGTIEDIDINLEDFVTRVNSDLVGKIANIASRTAGFVTKQFDATLSAQLEDEALWQQFVDAGSRIAEYYESCDTSKAVREITALADLANQYIAHHEPWKMVKDEAQRERLHLVCSESINLFRVLVIYLQPIVPAFAERARTFLNVEALAWTDAATPLGEHAIGKFKPLITRVDPKKVDAMLEHTEAEETESADEAGNASPDPEWISIDEFEKVELRVARIVAAEKVEGADRLLALTLDVGDERRNVFSGIREAYDPTDLVGRLTVMVANLAPRKMRFGVSQGMVLAAGPGGADIFLLSPDSGAEPGMRVT
ncbi:MAG: methionine--tRNA ligase [Pseudomonadales bacterium]|jgi:methionyl-tRNA synthetase|nr:methionine--tRNA ligase [Pseudomonadales bacterium]MDP6472024.1 methionine--tRNA ligase [Pseudomonadales bacterium]MDP6826703.1 methionine--tRNA ligase [Pseudomonadales bacterium]MDP6969936.1 methionine--tRNA ligase [Pseudomonadales bacterium]